MRPPTPPCSRGAVRQLLSPRPPLTETGRAAAGPPVHSRLVRTTFQCGLKSPGNAPSVGRRRWPPPFVVKPYGGGREYANSPACRIPCGCGDSQAASRHVWLSRRKGAGGVGGRGANGQETTAERELFLGEETHTHVLSHHSSLQTNVMQRPREKKKKCAE